MTELNLRIYAFASDKYDCLVENAKLDTAKMDSQFAQLLNFIGSRLMDEWSAKITPPITALHVASGRWFDATMPASTLGVRDKDVIVVVDDDFASRKTDVEMAIDLLLKSAAGERPDTTSLGSGAKPPVQHHNDDPQMVKTSQPTLAPTIESREQTGIAIDSAAASGHRSAASDQSVAPLSPMGFPDSTVTPVPKPVVPWGKCYAGLGATFELTAEDFEVLRTSGLEAFRFVVSPLMKNLKQQLAQLEKARPNLFKLVTLDPADSLQQRPFKPDEFMERAYRDLRVCYDSGIHYFEVAENPNMEKSGQTWRSGQDFGDWFAPTLQLLRKEFPEARFGFPGLLDIQGWERFLDDAADAVRQSDWIGVHCTWKDTLSIADTSSGSRWKLYQQRFPNQLLMITQFSNDNPNADLTQKGEDYARYFQLLRHEQNMGAAFAHASRLPNFPDLDRTAWTSDGRPTPIALTVSKFLSQPGFLDAQPRPVYVPLADSDTGTPSPARTLGPNSPVMDRGGSSFSIGNGDLAESDKGESNSRSISGGVNVDSNMIDIGGDVVGRDKIVTIVTPTVQPFRIEVISDWLTQLAPGENVPVQLRLTNTGTRAWQPPSSSKQPQFEDESKDELQVAYRIMPIDPASGQGEITGITIPLERAVAPQQTVTLDGTFIAPTVPGDYRVVWDLERASDSLSVAGRQLQYSLNLRVLDLPGMQAALTDRLPEKVSDRKALIEKMDTLLERPLDATVRQQIVEQGLVPAVYDPNVSVARAAWRTLFAHRAVLPDIESLLRAALAEQPTKAAQVRDRIAAYSAEVRSWIMGLLDAAKPTEPHDESPAIRSSQSTLTPAIEQLDESSEPNSAPVISGDVIGPDQIESGGSRISTGDGVTSSDTAATDSDGAGPDKIESDGSGISTGNGATGAITIGGDVVGRDKVVNMTVSTVVVQPSVQYARPAESRKVSVEVTVNVIKLTCGADRYASPNQLNYVELDAARLLSPQKYGELLFEGVFSTATMPGFENSTRVGYDKHVRGETEVIFELEIAPGDVTLNLLKWEYLIDPDNERGLPFALYEKSPFFRLLGGTASAPIADWPLRALAIICSPVTLGLPIDADGFPVDAQGVRANRNIAGLKVLDVPRERTILTDALKRMQELGAVEFRILDSDQGQPVTMDTLRTAITEFAPHILHVVAHGVTVLERFYLVMENDLRREKLVPVEDFDQSRFKSLRLVVLDTCQSANLAAKGTLHGLAPHLIGLGVPAVVAMQDFVPIPTAQRLTQWFYQHLSRSGRVDMALAATRLQLYDVDKKSWNWGIPVLFMSSDQGQLFDISDERAKDIPAAITPTDRKFAPTESETQSISRYLASQAAQLGAPPALVKAYTGWSTQPPSLPLLESQDRRALSDKIKNTVQIDGHDLAMYVNPKNGQGLQLGVEVFERIASALNAGKHIILIGPPGTGKTSLANRICEYAASRALCAGVTATTATADWTTFDTVGGYVPTQQQTLEFRPGVFLRAIADGKWLIIDEINRAEIDKAFGELFTLLSGQRVDLPYTVRGQTVCVRPGQRNDPIAWIPDDLIGRADDYHFVVHCNWRIIGTMNVYDKSYLFAMSFAFMRRFAFIDCDLPGFDPDRPDETNQPTDLYFELIKTWITDDFKLASGAALQAKLRDLIKRDTALMSRRALGPAILRDMLLFVKDRETRANGASPLSLLGEACLLYTVPQLDGLDRDDIFDIYGYLAGFFKTDKVDRALDKVRRNVLERIEQLYPHLRPDEWKKARGRDEY